MNPRARISRPTASRRGQGWTPRALRGGGVALLVALTAAWGLSTPAADAQNPPAPAKNTLTISVLPVPSTELGFADMPAGAPSLQCEATCGMTLPLAAVAFNPDGKLLAVGGFGEVLLWDLADAKLARRIGMGQLTSMVQAAVFTKDGKTLIVGEGTPYVSGAVRFYNVENGEQVAEFLEPQGLVNCLTLSPDGTLVVAGCGDGAAYVWAVADKKLLATLEGHSLAVLCAAFGSNGEFLATAGADTNVFAWDTKTWQRDLTPTAVAGTVRRCEIQASSKDQRTGVTVQTYGLLVDGRSKGSLQSVMDSHAQGWQRGREYRIPIDAGAPLDWVCLPRLGRKIFVACSDGTIKVFVEGPNPQKNNQATPLHRATLRGHTDWVYGLAATNDGTRLASASGDGTVKLWSTADSKLLATLAHLRPKTDDWLIVTADGYFATSNDAAVKWKTANLTVAEEKLAALKKPDAVRETLSGKPPAPPSLQ